MTDFDKIRELIDKIEQEQEIEEKPNIEQISKCYSHQCDLVLKKFAERLKEKFNSDDECLILTKYKDGYVKNAETIGIKATIDEVLKEFVK